MILKKMHKTVKFIYCAIVLFVHFNLIKSAIRDEEINIGNYSNEVEIQI